MRLVLTSLTFALCFATLASEPAAAQDYPYCLQGQRWGYPGNCSFSTYAQCMATASGTIDGCGINPRFAYAPQRGWYSGGYYRRY